MNQLKKAFGIKAAKKNTTLPHAIQKVKTTEAELAKKQAYLEAKINKEIAFARDNAKKNKKAALEALHRKKRWEKELQKIDGALTTLESQRDALETANINQLAVSSMDKASKALKKTNKQMNVDQVEDLLQNLEDQREFADEISNVISNPVGFLGDDMNEEELEKELQELQIAEKSEIKPSIKVDELPSIPQQEIAIAEEELTPTKKKRAAPLPPS